MKYVAPNGKTVETDNPNVLNLLEREGFKPVEEKPKKK